MRYYSWHAQEYREFPRVYTSKHKGSLREKEQCSDFTEHFRAVSKIDKRDYRLRHVCCLCVCPYGTTRLPLDGLPWHLLLQHLFFFFKSVGKNDVSLKSDQNNGYFTWIPVYIYDNIWLIILRMRNVSNKICRENQNTQFMFNDFFPPENRAVYEIMWKNIVHSGRPQMTI